MAGAAAELKVVISIVQDTKNDLAAAVRDLQSIYFVLKGLDATTLQNLGAQLQAFQQRIADTRAQAETIAKGITTPNIAGSPAELEASAKKLTALVEVGKVLGGEPIEIEANLPDLEKVTTLKSSLEKGIEIPATVGEPNVEDVKATEKALQAQPIIIPALITSQDTSRTIDGVKEIKTGLSKAIEIDTSLAVPDTQALEEIKVKLERDPLVITAKVKPQDPTLTAGVPEAGFSLAGPQPALPFGEASGVAVAVTADTSKAVRAVEEFKTSTKKPVDVDAKVSLDTKAIEDAKSEVKKPVEVDAQLALPELDSFIDVKVEAAKPIEVGSQFLLPDLTPWIGLKRKVEDDPIVVPTVIKPPEIPPVSTNLGGPELEKVTKDIGLMGLAAGAASGGVNTLDAATSKLGSTLRFLAGGFLALSSIKFLKGLADEAARVEVLGTVLDVVAFNAGQSKEVIGALDKQIQALGITAASSRQSLTRFLQANLDIKYAGQLARVSQDLAVIAGWDSSQTFERLITNIQQLDSLGLRWMGIIINRDQAMKDFAKTLNTTAEALTKEQKTEAFTIAVLKEAEELAGVYSAAMGDVGKQITSLDRVTKTYRATLGEALLPAYSVIIEEVTLMFEQLTLLAGEVAANRTAAQALADVTLVWMVRIRESVLWIARHKDEIFAVVKAYLAFKAVMLAVSGVVATFTAISKLQQVFVLLASTRTIVTNLINGALTYASALRVVRSATVAQTLAEELMAAARAKAAVGQAAAAASLTATASGLAATTGAVALLSSAWVSLGATLAIPAIGYAIYKVKTQMDEENSKSLLTKAAEKATRIADQKAGIGNPLDYGATESLEPEFQRWKSELGPAPGRDETKMRAEFDRLVSEESQKIKVEKAFVIETDIYNKVRAASGEVERLKNELDTAKASGNTAQESTATKLLEQATAEEKRLNTALATAAGLQTVSQATRDVSDQYAKQLEVTRRYKQALSDGLNPKDQEAPIAKELAASKAQTATMLRVWEARARSEKGMTDEQIRQEEALLTQRLNLLERRDQAREFSTAEESFFGGKTTFDETGAASAIPFATKAQGFEAFITEAKFAASQDFWGESENLATMAEKFKLAFQQLALAVETPVDLANLKKIGGEARQYGLTAQDMAQSVSRAAINVRDSQRAFSAPLVAEQKARQETKDEKVIQQRTQEQAIVAQINSDREQVEKVSYDRGLITIDQYHEGRLTRLREAGLAEARVQEAQIAKLQNSLNLTPVENREDVRNAIQAAMDKLTLLLGQEEAQRRVIEGLILDLGATRDKKRLADLEAQIQAEQKKLFDMQAAGTAIPGTIALGERAETREEDSTRKSYLEQVIQLEQEVASYYGGESAEIDQINTKYTQMAERMKVLGDARGQDALAAAKQRDINRVIIESEDRRLQNQLRLKEAAFSQSETAVQTEIQAGNLSPAEAIRATNALIREQVVLNEERTFIQEQHLARLEAEREVQSAINELEILRKATTAGETLSEEEKARRLADSLQTMTEGIDEAKIALIGMDNETQRLMASLDGYGKRLKDTFQNSLGNAISDSMKGLQSAKDAVIRLGEDIRNNITDAIGENISAKLTKKLVSSTQTLGKDGKPTENGVFDSIFSMLGLADEDDFGHSASKPLYVKEVSAKVSTDSVLDYRTFLDSQTFLDSSKFGGDTFEAIKGIGSNLKDILSSSSTNKTVGGVPITPGTPYEFMQNLNSFKTLFSFAKGGRVSFAEGGQIIGPGTGTSDSIPAMVSNGEYVMPAKQTSVFLPLLERMRAGDVSAYAEGGTVVGAGPAPGSKGAVFMPLLTQMRAGPVNAYAEGGMVSSPGAKFLAQMRTGAVQSFAEGGSVTGPGTGTSDSVPAMVSNGEYVMPAAQTSLFFPLLEDMRAGNFQKFAVGGSVGDVQSIAISPTIPTQPGRGGGTVTDGGVSSVRPAKTEFVLEVHPDALHTTLEAWFRQEVARQSARR